MRRLFVLLALTALSGCARAQYITLPLDPPRINVSRGVATVSVDLVGGECRVTVTVRGDQTGSYIARFPRSLCEEAETAQAAIATVPQPKPAEPGK